MAAHADESHRLSTLDQETVDKLGDVKIGDGTLGHEKEFPPAPKSESSRVTIRVGGTRRDFRERVGWGWVSTSLPDLDLGPKECFVSRFLGEL